MSGADASDNASFPPLCKPHHPSTPCPAVCRPDIWRSTAVTTCATSCSAQSIGLRASRRRAKSSTQGGRSGRGWERECSLPRAAPATHSSVSWQAGRGATACAAWLAAGCGWKGRHVCACKWGQLRTPAPRCNRQPPTPGGHCAQHPTAGVSSNGELRTIKVFSLGDEGAREAASELNIRLHDDSGVFGRLRGVHLDTAHQPAALVTEFFEGHGLDRLLR